MRSHKVLYFCILLAASGSGQSSEIGRLKELVGEYDFASQTVGVNGSYVGRVGYVTKTVSLTPNSVAFKEEFEVQASQFSRTKEMADAELRFDEKTKQYIFNFKTMVFSQPRSIKDMRLNYADSKGWEGSGDISIGDRRAPAEVSITLDRTKGEHTWTINVNSSSDNPRESESYRFAFAKRSQPSGK